MKPSLAGTHTHTHTHTDSGHCHTVVDVGIYCSYGECPASIVVPLCMCTCMLNSSLCGLDLKGIVWGFEFLTWIYDRTLLVDLHWHQAAG